MGRRGANQRVYAELFRIVHAFTLFSMLVYIAVAPREMIKVKAEIVTVSFAAFTIVLQVYVIFAKCCPFPYAITPLIVLDAFCGVCWVASVAVLSYWYSNVVYMPREGDPDWWFACANAAKWEDTITITAGGDYVRYINIVWCEVEVNGQHRLVGNSRAREQLRVMIALSAVSLLFIGMTVTWMVRKGKSRGLIGHDRDLEDVASDTSEWSR